MASGPSRPINVGSERDLYHVINQNHRETQSRINQVEAKIPIIVKSTATIQWGSVGANSTQERTVNIQNITPNGVPSVSPKASLGATPFIWSVYITKTNQVTIRLLNPTGAPATPNTVLWNIVVAQS